MKFCSFVFIASLTFSGHFIFASPTGQIVKEILPGSNYEKFGIKTGDKIISYDGKDVNSVNDSMQMYNKLKIGSVKAVVIERDGKTQTLTYQKK